MYDIHTTDNDKNLSIIITNKHNYNLLECDFVVIL